MNVDILREMHGMIYLYTLFLLVFGGCLPVFEALTTYAKAEASKTLQMLGFMMFSCFLRELDANEIGITPPSFATDGVIWHVTLDCGCESIDPFRIFLNLVFSPILKKLCLQLAGGSHLASNIQIKKPLCLIGGGELPDETNVICLRGSDSALEFLSTCKLTNLTVKAELGCCLLHRSGRLIIDECILQCESNPLDYLSCPIVSTAGSGVFPSNLKSDGDSISVSHTRIEGGAKAVLTSGDLALQQVRVIYARTCLYFWFDVDCR
ncbi:F-box SKIP5 -like protein [Gossypium arboreum]|uniref:F-box SKIP5-like protein n=1 Tax=Gossypium arboreum TaxID=29729 RepID=A0A0B0NXP8_GOSAR|nr:F-box SKIP5 -like protein [Gossypium arboreum]